MVFTIVDHEREDAVDLVELVVVRLFVVTATAGPPAEIVFVPADVVGLAGVEPPVEMRDFVEVSRGVTAGQDVVERPAFQHRAGMRPVRVGVHDAFGGVHDFHVVRRQPEGLGSEIVESPNGEPVHVALEIREDIFRVHAADDRAFAGLHERLEAIHKRRSIHVEVGRLRPE